MDQIFISEPTLLDF